VLMVSGPMGHWSERSPVVISGDLSDSVSVRVSRFSRVVVWVSVWVRVRVS